MTKKSKKHDWNIAFFGTPRFAVSVLEELKAAGIVPSLVVTQPDKPKGRGLALAESAVKSWAREKGVASLEPATLDARDPQTELLWNSDWDLFVIVAYGKLLPPDILKLPRKGTLNVHPSLLPRFRGPSPIESQILADERETGVSIMLVDEELDHGPVLAQASITPEEWPLRASMLEEMLARAGGELLAEVIPAWDAEEFPAEPQEHARATFTKKITKEDGLLDLSNDGYANYLKFCAYDEWPGTYFFLRKDGEDVRVKIADAKYENGTFTPTRVVPEGKKEVSYEDFVRGSSSSS
ncbi:MAG: methionyl-tRNA formyltransferase [Patescibacteria group bacterium]